MSNVRADARGRPWVSDFYAHQVVAIGFDGSIERMASAPRQPSGLGFRPDGRTLLLCVAPSFAESGRSVARDAKVLATRVKVPHAGLP